MRLKIVLLWISILLCSNVVLAQSGASKLVINHVETIDVNGQQILRTYFTPTDAIGVAVPDLFSQIQAGTVVLQPGASYPVNIIQPTTPLYLVLVLDTSGSMDANRASQTMLQAAQDAVDSAPQNTSFAVIEFNDTIDTTLNFTTDREVVKTEIVNTSFGGGTCLNDATGQGIHLFDGLAPEIRRALIVFTDGRDEKNIDEKLDPCSTIYPTYSDLIDMIHSLPNHVMVNTIGLRGRAELDTSFLSSLAQETGGFFVAGVSDQLGVLFNQIMSALGAQLMAEVPVCITQGTYSATLNLQLSDSKFLVDATTFEAVSGCNATATPLPSQTPIAFNTNIRGQRHDPQTDTITFEMIQIGASEVAYYKIEVYDDRNNLILEPQRVELGQEIRLSTASFNHNRDFTSRIEVTAFDANDNMLGMTQKELGIDWEATATPVPTETPVPVSVTSEEGYHLELSQLTVSFNLNFTGLEYIETLNVRLVAPSGALVYDQDFFPKDTIQISLGDLTEEARTGQYILLLRPTLYASSPATANETRQEVNLEIPVAPTSVPTSTPTFTPTTSSTPTFTPSPTLEPFKSVLTDLTYTVEQSNCRLAFTVLQTGFDPGVGRYELVLTNSDTNRLVDTQIFNSLLNNKELPFVIDAAKVLQGKYTATLNTFDVSSNLISSPSTLSFNYTPDSICSPEPTPNLLPLLLIVSLLLLFIIGLVSMLVRLRQVAPIPAFPAPNRPAPGTRAIGLPVETTKRTPIPDTFREILAIERTNTKKLKGDKVQISQTPYILGRPQDVKDERVDLEFSADEPVSRKHAQFIFAEGHYYLEDLGSTNGTYVNGEKLNPNDRRRLNEGVNSISLGEDQNAESVKLVLKIDSANTQQVQRRPGTTPREGGTVIASTTQPKRPVLGVRVVESQTPNQQGKFIPLVGEALVLGRSIQFGDDPGVSKQHARISFEDGKYYIEDLNSSNHTYLNDSDAYLTAKTELTPSTKISLGVEDPKVMPPLKAVILNFEQE
jgi:pSer/pThr/pTyr-binding forkhead associated (FHA) protein